MDPAFRVGIEIRLQPDQLGIVPRGSAPGTSGTVTGDQPGAVFRHACVLADAASSAGFGSVWLDPGARPLMDAMAVAAAVCARVPGIPVGVAASLETGRHPALVAREVTAVDVVSSGRAALRLAPGNVVPAGLLEAARICRSLLRGERTTIDGAFYQVLAAVNRPVRAGGPPLFVDVAPTLEDPADLAALVGEPAVDGFVVGPSADPVPVWGSTVGGKGAPGQVLLRRGALGPEPEDAAAHARALLDDGADGVILCQGLDRDAFSPAWITAAGRAFDGAFGA